MPFRYSFDLSVYFIADPSVCGGRDVDEIVHAAARGGATMVQLRNKSGHLDELRAQILACQGALQNFEIPFLINDHVDLAHELGADGVHLGQGDMDPAHAREILGEDKIIGLTAFEPSHMEALNPEIVDYAGTGPFYETQTRKGKPLLGQEGGRPFKDLLNNCPVPVVGIGGIEPDTAAHVIQCGAAGVAMMRSVSEADDPQEAVAEFVRAVASARRTEAGT